jgi:hypothetical protein
MRWFLLLLLAPSLAFGQNLVPNPSFEDTMWCPTSGDQVDASQGWANYSDESPDYFNSCDTIFGFSVPYNWGGYQPAASGVAYCALSTFFPSIPDGREFIGRDLSNPLSIGTKYFASFKTALSVDANISASYAANNLGFLFSTSSFSFSNPAPVGNFAHVYDNTIITDTMNWTTVFGSFIADSNYTHLVIGNFFDDASTDTIKMVTGAPAFIWAYYYIDDVCVSTDSAYCANFVGVKEKPTQQSFKIYPNPTNGVITVEGLNAEVFDILGRPVPFTARGQTLDISPLPKGVYIVKVGEAVRKVVLQ